MSAEDATNDNNNNTTKETDPPDVTRKRSSVPENSNDDNETPPPTKKQKIDDNRKDSNDDANTTTTTDKTTTDTNDDAVDSTKDTKCSVWLPKKKRACKHDTVHDSQYCRFHLPADSASNVERTECEYCKTLIFQKTNKRNKQHNLSGHYHRCPVKRKLDALKKQAFYRENLHFYGDLNGQLLPTAAEHKQKQDNDKCMEYAQFQQHLKRRYHASLQSTLTPVTNEHSDATFQTIRDAYLAVHKEKENLKHCKQIESIVSHIDKMCDLQALRQKTFTSLKKQTEHAQQQNDAAQLSPAAPPPLVVLELGAGKASLGTMLHSYFDQQSKLVMIDVNSNFRHKEENRLENVANFHRIQCGLQHCDLSQMQMLQEYCAQPDAKMLVVSKHLCGGATDFGLRCILNSNLVSHVQVIAIALCCRGKCSADTYCNVDYLRSALETELSAQQFEWIRAMSSWDIDRDGGYDENDMNEHFEMGHLCRRLIDEGRVQWLKRMGFQNVRLVQYCSRDVSKENILLIASKT